MDSIVIKRDTHAMWRQVTYACIAFLVCALLIQVVLVIMLRDAPGARMILNLILWGGVLICILAFVFGRRAAWEGEYYELTSDSLIIHKKSFGLGSTESSYQYDSIQSVDVRRSRADDKFNAGEITLRVPFVEGGLSLEHVSEPSRVAQEIQRRISQNKVYGRRLDNSDY